MMLLMKLAKLTAKYQKLDLNSASLNPAQHNVLVLQIKRSNSPLKYVVEAVVKKLNTTNETGKPSTTLRAALT